MRTDTDRDVAPVDTDPAMVHHHVRMSEREYLRALDLGLPMKALCGDTRPPVRNPLALPCCPMCAELKRNGTCIGGQS